VPLPKVAFLIAVLMCNGLAGCGSETEPAMRALDGRTLARGRLASFSNPFRFFSPSSVWNHPVPANASLDPRSAAMVTAFEEGIALERLSGGGPGVNTTDYSVPIYTVPVGQPTVRVRLISRRREPALQAAWNAVPLPQDALPAAGTDGHLVLWQPSTDRLWEFWQLARGADGWQANWGGAMRHVSSNPGVYGPKAWRGAKRSWGASASSFSIAGGLITLEDLEQGQINHALAMAIPDVRAGVYAAPARRTDGKSADPRSLPEGAHLRLDPTLNLARLHLPRFTLMIAEAAQRYGIIVRDTASHVTLYAQDPTPTGTDPYSGPRGYFEGLTPVQLLASFPWSQLQVLRLALRPTTARS
jgi:hypothetical protein